MQSKALCKSMKLICCIDLHLLSPHYSNACALKAAGILSELLHITTDNKILPHITRVSELNLVLDSIDISESDIIFAISNFKNNLACGPDGLPPTFCRQLKHSIAAPLRIVFTCSGPDEWKSAIIIPVFKKGVPSSVSNYRPKSLTCVFSKLWNVFYRVSYTNI